MNRENIPAFKVNTIYSVIFISYHSQFEFIDYNQYMPKTVADFKYGVNTDVNIGVSVSRGGNTLFEVMGIC